MKQHLCFLTLVLLATTISATNWKYLGGPLHKGLPHDHRNSTDNIPDALDYLKIAIDPVDQMIYLISTDGFWRIQSDLMDGPYEYELIHEIPEHYVPGYPTADNTPYIFYYDRSIYVMGISVNDTYNVHKFDIDQYNDDATVHWEVVSQINIENGALIGFSGISLNSMGTVYNDAYYSYMLSIGAKASEKFHDLVKYDLKTNEWELIAQYEQNDDSPSGTLCNQVVDDDGNFYRVECDEYVEFWSINLNEVTAAPTNWTLYYKDDMTYIDYAGHGINQCFCIWRGRQSRHIAIL
eukprot:TRINITY_DN1179_c0_g1_i1.p1 TRINITY_DN1179_c0_g1~~TRINITY_DN1179_c0_g1_i1.p1  ORF type:complete len:306 (-),score=57.18 TRINITY_DN1179_c0_g1_i1:638-1519(-)